MDKKIIAGVAAAVVVIGGVAIYKTAQPTPQKAIKALDLRFTGYEGHADIVDDDKYDKSEFEAYSILAKYEAKKADVDQKIIKDAIQSSAGDPTKLRHLLTDSDTFLSLKSTGSDEAKVDNFVEHFQYTDWNGDYQKAENGNKVVFTLADNSTSNGEPYFKPISFKVKISGLKNPQKITTRQLSKIYSYNVSGINGRGVVRAKVSKDVHNKYGLKNIDILNVSNGDKVTLVTNKQLKRRLPEQYKLVDNGDIKYTVSGLTDKKDLKLTGLQNDLQKFIEKNFDMKKVTVFGVDLDKGIYFQGIGRQDDQMMVYNSDISDIYKHDYPILSVKNNVLTLNKKQAKEELTNPTTLDGSLFNIYDSDYKQDLDNFSKNIEPKLQKDGNYFKLQ